MLHLQTLFIVSLYLWAYGFISFHVIFILRWERHVTWWQDKSITMNPLIEAMLSYVVIAVPVLPGSACSKYRTSMSCRMLSLQTCVKGLCPFSLTFPTPCQRIKPQKHYSQLSDEDTSQLLTISCPNKRELESAREIEKRMKTLFCKLCHALLDWSAKFPVLLWTLASIYVTPSPKKCECSFPTRLTCPFEFHWNVFNHPATIPPSLDALYKLCFDADDTLNIYLISFFVLPQIISSTPASPEVEEEIYFIGHSWQSSTALNTSHISRLPICTLKPSYIITWHRYHVCCSRWVSLVS